MGEKDDSVWKSVLKMTDPIPVDYESIESLFCQKTVDKTKKEEAVKVKPPTEINLLDMKRSMNANIFLKQFKASHDEVVSMVRTGDSAQIGTERLRGLHKILPDKEEMAMIKVCLAE